MSKNFVLNKIKGNNFTRWTKTIALTTFFIIISSNISFAAEAPYMTFFEANNPKSYVLNIGGVSVVSDKSTTQRASTVVKNANISIDSIPVTFTDETGYPYVDANGRTQVPVKAVMEAFGCEVEWYGAPNQRMVGLFKGEEIVYVPIERKLLLVSKWEYAHQTDTVAIIKDGRTYMPIRRVLEFFGAKVDWDKETNTVNVNSHPTSNIVKEGSNLLDVISSKMAEDILYKELDGYIVLDNGYDYKVNFIVCSDHMKGKMTRLAFANFGMSYLIDWNGNELDWDGGPFFQSNQMTAHMYDCDFKDAQYLAFTYDAREEYKNKLILVPTSSIK